MQTHRAPIVCWYRVHGVVDLRRYVLSHVLSSLSFLPASRNSDPGSNGRLFSPLPLQFVPCFFLRERLHPSLSSLVDSRRIGHISTRGALRSCSRFREINPTYHHDRIRTPGPSLRTYRIRGVQTTGTRIEKCRFCWSWLFAVGYASTYVGITL